jgi:hypothetical protein
MGTLKEESIVYESPRTLNVADLDKIPIDIELLDARGLDNKGEEFVYKYVVVDEKEYRVPGIVMAGIKAILEKKPRCQFVSVVKTGQGLGTKYQVIPMD